MNIVNGKKETLDRCLSIIHKQSWLKTNSDDAVFFDALAGTVRAFRFPYHFPVQEKGRSIVADLVTAVADLVATFLECPEELDQRITANQLAIGVDKVEQNLRAFLRSREPQDVAEIAVCLRDAKSAAKHFKLLQRARICTVRTEWSDFSAQSASGSIYVGGNLVVFHPMCLNC